VGEEEEESRSSTCRPCAALKDVAYSTKLESVCVAMPGTVMADDDNVGGDVMVVIVLSLLLLPTAWTEIVDRRDGVADADADV